MKPPPSSSVESWSGGARPAGESWVWVTGMGLAIGLLMIVFLLGMIFWNGLEVFWPKRVVQLELREGSAAAIGEKRFFGGEIVKRQLKSLKRLDEAGEPLPPDPEWQLFVGNKDAYGFSYRYIDVAEIAAMTQPRDIIVAERMEYGNAIFRPRELQLSDGRTVAAGETDFERVLQELVDEANERRGVIKRIERHQIGRINRAIEQLRLEQRALPNASASPAAASRRTAIEADLARLDAEYQVLAAAARELRDLQDSAHLVYETLDGRERRISVGSLVHFYRPNDIGFFSRAGLFLHRFWGFLSEEPREANTEGGIFPAIFGTFVMTLLMSVAVTPFGVLAAIYLREYAKQGLFVRSVRIAVNNLAGVPSIVFGVFGLGFFVYLVGGSIDQLFYSLRLPTPTFGTGGILWASLTLALMTVPVVIVATEEALAAVSRGTREGSLACGASKWQTIQRIVLPASLPGILTGLILAMARGAGEVAPLMLVGVVKLAPTLPLDLTPPFVHFERKFMHLGFHIFDLGFQSPDSEAAKPMVFATTFLLILLVVALNLGAIVIRNRLRKKYRVSTF
jgi:phosphate transport system permease protein